MYGVYRFIGNWAVKYSPLQPSSVVQLLDKKPQGLWFNPHPISVYSVFFLPCRLCHWLKKTDIFLKSNDFLKTPQPLPTSVFFLPSYGFLIFSIEVQICLPLIKITYKEEASHSCNYVRKWVVFILFFYKKIFKKICTKQMKLLLNVRPKGKDLNLVYSLYMYFNNDFVPLLKAFLRQCPLSSPRWSSAFVLNNRSHWN